MSHPPPDVANEMIARIIINKICSVFIVPTYGGQIPLFVHGLRLFQPNFSAAAAFDQSKIPGEQRPPTNDLL